MNDDKNIVEKNKDIAENLVESERVKASKQIDDAKIIAGNLVESERVKASLMIGNAKVAAGNLVESERVKANMLIETAKVTAGNLIEIAINGSESLLNANNSVKQTMKIEIDNMKITAMKQIEYLKKNATIVSEHLIANEEVIVETLKKTATITDENVKKTAMNKSKNLEDLANLISENLKKTENITPERMVRNAKLVDEHLQENAIHASEYLKKTAMVTAENLMESARIAAENMKKTAMVTAENLIESARITAENMKKTAMVTAEDLMIDITEQIVRTSRKKDEFAAMISHELRTPLVPILGYCELLTDLIHNSGLTKSQIESIEGINRNSKRLIRLIEDILILQKLEMHKMKFEKKEVQTVSFMKNIVDLFMPEMGNKKIKFTNITSENHIFTSDPDRLVQVFGNLIKNAIDFVPNNGMIEIGAKDENLTILFHVKDNGIGIPKEVQNHLFEIFGQVTASIKRTNGGTGLGLSVCKGIVEGLGGKIWVESEEGKGSTFYFTVPKKIA